MRKMILAGDLSEGQESILCHRTIHMLMESAVVGGHPGVTGAFATEVSTLDPKTGEEKKEHAVQVSGNMLVDCISSLCVDWVRCSSNDVWETYNTLGVEACCNILFDQIKQVVSFDGTYVDDRHLMLIVDTICRSGSLMPLNRHGINRTESSPLMRASFEETTDILCDAAVFAQCENARGITTSIMTGQLSRMGTGNTEVLFSKNLLAPVAAVELNRKSSKRVLKSTCRSYTKSDIPETVECVVDNVTPLAPGPLSPPVVRDGHTRKRARFRPVSPC